MKPNQLLSIYFTSAFFIGIGLSAMLAHLESTKAVGILGGAVLTTCWNVFFLMILPLVQDWAQHNYCRARFIPLEEVKTTNPQLANILQNLSKRFSLGNLKLAIADVKADAPLSYGLLGSNPRLIVPQQMLDNLTTTSEESLEDELYHLTQQDHTLMFFMFTALQIIVQQALVVLV
jgi:Zn-dependent protease with chaperone function